MPNCRVFFEFCEKIGDSATWGLCLPGSWCGLVGVGSVSADGVRP